LEKENQRLAAELTNALDQAGAGKPAGGSSLRSTPIPPASETPSSASRTDATGSQFVPKETYETLVRKFNRLYENHKDISSARDQLEKALVDKKKKYRDYYDILEERIKKRDTTIRQRDEEVERLKAQDQDVIILGAPSTQLSYEGSASASELPMLLTGGENGNEIVVETDFEALEPYTSTTSKLTPHTSPRKAKVPEVKEEPSTDAPPSPDTPVVISSRSVRKSRSRKDAVEPNINPRVKIETISSSPIGLAALFTLDESIDLDDIGEKQITPRKGRPFLQQALSTSSSLANAVRDEAQISQHIYSNGSSNSQFSQETPIRGVGIKRTGSVLQPRSPNTLILPRTSAERAQKRRRIASDQAVSGVLEDGDLMESIEMRSRKRNTATPEQAKLLPDLLAKPSPPERVLSPTRPIPAQPRPRHTGGAPAVSSRAYEVSRNDTLNTPNFGPPLSKAFARSLESTEAPRPTSKGSIQSSKEPSRPSSKGSLRGSVEPPRPASRSTLRDSAYESSPTSRDTPETRPSSKGSPGRPKLLKSAVKAVQSRSKEQIGTPNPTKSRNQPLLRTRPLHELILQDFKVNPKYNQGYGYAFREVVRNQADRRCLPGCTKPDCCGGKFRVLAEATRDPNKTTTASQEEADEKILKEFLGDNSYKLRNMTEAERYETLMQALTRDMSNKMGKHRHAYERRQSPPGYWRSDFPNTQERTEDRAKAAELEREQLAHRYEEAMRGGAYIFRDE
jgi:hypothetical protein